MPEMQLSSVLLPAPFGPISPTMDPVSTAKLTSLQRVDAAEIDRLTFFDRETRHRSHALPREAHAPCPTAPAA